MNGLMIRAGAVRHLITIWWVKVSPSLTVISSNPSIFAMSKKLKVSSTLNSRKMGVARADEVAKTPRDPREVSPDPRRKKLYPSRDFH